MHALPLSLPPTHVTHVTHVTQGKHNHGLARRLRDAAGALTVPRRKHGRLGPEAGAPRGAAQ
jgi:hypothetical protein